MSYIIQQTVDAVASTLITASRMHDEPCGLSGINNLLNVMNGNLGDVVGSLDRLVKSQRLEGPEARLAPTMRSLTDTISGLNTGVKDMKGAIREMTASTRDLQQAIVAQTATRRGLFQANIDVQQKLCNQMKQQASAFTSGHHRFAGLIEDEKRGGEAPAIVRHLLSPRQAEECETMMREAALEFDPRSAPVFGPPIRKRTQPQHPPAPVKAVATLPDQEVAAEPTEKAKVHSVVEVPTEQSLPHRSPLRPEWRATLKTLRTHKGKR